jgi:hypothetical protein
MVGQRHHVPPLLVGVTLAVAALGFGGCGASGSPTVKATTTPTSSATRSVAPSATGTSEAMIQYVAGMRRYVACMRKNGINLPDPDADGAVDYSSVSSTYSDAKVQAATDECAGVLPVAPGASVGGGRPLEDRPAAH